MSTEADDLVVEFETLEEMDSTASAEHLFKHYMALAEKGTINEDDISTAVIEKCMYKIANIMLKPDNKTKDLKAPFNDILGLLQHYNVFFSYIPKAKTAKIVRNILDIVASFPNSIDSQVSLCEDVVDWCKKEKRTFLRQRIEARLATLLLETGKQSDALKLVNSLLTELKKLDDKQMLTETHLTEARIYFRLQNISKSKAALTASRTAANAIYVAPLLQADIDAMSGMLQCEEGDPTTAFSYFLEAFEGYDQSSANELATRCLQYMMLCKVLDNKAQEVAGLISGKYGLKYKSTGIEGMGAIAKAAVASSLQDFQKAVDKYSSAFKSDVLVSNHLEVLYHDMLEANLMKLIHPFSCVEVDHIAKLIKLEKDVVEKKLSQMILDHKCAGVLDQGKGHLILFDESQSDMTFTKGMSVITHLETTVEALYQRAQTAT